MIPVKMHPTLPAGTIMAVVEELPAYFRSNQIPAMAEILTRQDYYRIDWPIKTRQRLCVGFVLPLPLNAGIHRFVSASGRRKEASTASAADLDEHGLRERLNRHG